MGGSFLGLLDINSPLLDFDLFDILSESIFDGLDDIELLSLEGVEISTLSDFEFGDLGVLLDEDG